VEQVLKIPPAKTTVVTATTAAATAAVVAFQKMLNGLHGKDVRIGVRYNEGGRDSTGGITKDAATGGAIVGPGTGTSDSIPANLSNGEHVWTAAEVAILGGQESMYRLRGLVRTGALRGFAAGGAVEYGVRGFAGGGSVDLARLPAIIPAGMGGARTVTTHAPVIVEHMEVADYTDFRAQEADERRLQNVGGGL
jgi:hypothetical protein